MGRFNGVKEQPLADKLVYDIETDHKSVDEAVDKQQTGWSYVRQHTDVLVNWLIMIVQWMVVSFCYY